MSPIESRSSGNGVARAAWAETWRHLKVDRRSPGYCRVTFHRPSPDTAAGTMLAELDELIGLIEADRDLGVVVFESTDMEFQLCDRDPGSDPAWLDVLERLSRAPVVSIASIRGRARGAGAELALACDLRFGSRENTLLAELMADEADAVAARLARFDNEALARAKSYAGGSAEA